MSSKFHSSLHVRAPSIAAIGLAAAAMALAVPAMAQLDQASQTERQNNESSAEAQTQIDQVADQTEDMVDEYRHTLGQIESLTAYNQQLQGIVEDQERRKTSIADQLEGLEDTSREIAPLMMEMVDMFERVINADVPFKLAERQALAQTLRDNLNRADVTESEKFRQVLDSYATEIEFGHTADSYQGALPDGTEVEFLRVGRTLLYYQSRDGSVTGWYNPDSGEFEELNDRYRQPVSDGLAIVRNEVAPDLVRLRVPAARDAQ